MYFLQNDMTRVVEILAQVRQGPLNIVNIIAADGQGISSHTIDQVKPR